MLEEKNDNLQDADGKLSTDSNESNLENATLEKESVTEPVLDNEAVAENANQKALNSIDDSNAEESEDETLKDRHEIPMQDYDTLSMEALVEELSSLVATDKVMSIKEHVDEIKKAFLAKFNHFIEEKKEEFHAENPDTTEDFHYHSPLKIKFDQVYNQYKTNKNVHFKSLQTNLKTNLENRLAIVEELKELINPQENIKDTLKHFNELRDRWKNAGSIPKDKYNHVWNNYHFHVENFYDYLHLDREARDLDFKHNLEQKQKIILRVEELLHEEDINKAFRELQDLHRMWKEDIGPVSKENRDEIWNLFSDLTKKMHDKRELLFEKLRGAEVENLEKKKEIIAAIEELATVKVNAHSQWLGQIEKVEALRTAFFNAGKVPSDVNEETWSAFKTAVRNFNSFKNSFYKDIKRDQTENLNKKNALVAKAKELQDSTDFAVTTPIMKRIQDEWKQIGHVPRKYSDKVWKEFKEACNHYFDKLKEQKNEENAEEITSFENKKTYLETLREFQLTGDHKIDLDAIKAHIEAWKSLGRVPHARRHIEGKFNKILDALFDKLSLSKKETDMMRFANRIDQLSEDNDTRKLENEKIFLIRKIDEVQNEIFQLENNIQFFTNTKNAKKENSIVLEVRKNIAIHKESLDVWKEKLAQLRNLNQE
ncbi:DUF349 domain-containing protein [Flavobacterium muglaense]|uniref:DUF349 domain-containing protein n=1 Tax=Flavobacterium muglaense TaxID=2764716 RepID=A0A923MZQ4_9FLAO|nr:DUF349 domain-containing protein [Flavobacterium muglaense]MBC5836651.1 DUF349 domain-containing protein [Flavobacterium muglaense]MBC5843083.1 DUF349 domain-containing protein [Flavobacterium muglaense]